MEEMADYVHRTNLMVATLREIVLPVVMKARHRS